MKALIITLLILTATQALADCDDSEQACPVTNIDRQCYRDCRDQGYTYGYCMKQCKY